MHAPECSAWERAQFIDLPSRASSPAMYCEALNELERLNLTNRHG